MKTVCIIPGKEDSTWPSFKSTRTTTKLQL